ncbi:MAG TPA: tyrosine-type recombinase/integrase [Nakamurella sp.]
MTFRAERACAVDGGSVRWVVVDDAWALHLEACAFLESLRAADRSPNTERVYAGRVALFLNWCVGAGVDWMAPTFVQLHGFLRWLATTPYATRRSTGAARVRSKSTANAVFTTVSELLRFGATQGWVSPQVPAMITSQKYLRFAPAGYDVGEQGQFRHVQVRSIKYREPRRTPEYLSAEQVDAVLRSVSHCRDRFLLLLMVTTGMRVGEALGLSREDMHFLARSDALGCRLGGSHVHVRRRVNENGALAKSRYERTIPVNPDVVEAYADYQFERDGLLPGSQSDAVFVNLFRPPLGQAMRYSNVKDLFDRIADQCGFPVRPHLLRHTAATRWIESGVAPDVVQALLGHAAFISTSVYLHASAERMRAAVEHTAGPGHVPVSADSLVAGIGAR